MTMSVRTQHRKPPALSRLVKLSLPLLVVAVMGIWAGTASAASDSYFESILPQFMCTTCHEPLELVSSPQAKAEKSYLQGLVNQNLTLGEIKTEMVAQYGTTVLAKPPATGFNLIVYVLPPAVVLGGLLLLVYTLPKWRRRARAAAQTSLPGSDPLKPEEASRLDSELDQFI